MHHNNSALQNNGLSQYIQKASPSVVSAISQASEKSGVDFSYLVKQAAVESNFNPNAKAKTSSATGLYQFIDSTWIDMIQNHGQDYGLDVQGKSRNDILNMRKDPKAASFMAAAFASENEQFLNQNWGGNVKQTELYLAHFMGASGAASFLNARDENPMQNAADLFPRAAKANRNVFYDKDTGQARSLENVYRFFDQKFQNKPQEITESKAPIPQEKPTFVVAQSDQQANKIHRISDHIIMQRAQAMRDNTTSHQTETNGSITGSAFLLGHNILHDNDTHIFRTARSAAATTTAQQNGLSDTQRQSPYMGLVHKPIDLMLLVQTTEPTKVLRDNA